MQTFAMLTGFDGDTAAWREEFLLLCADLSIDATVGVDFELFAALAGEAKSNLEPSPKGLPNLAWSFAKASVRDPELFHALAMRTVPLLAVVEQVEKHILRLTWSEAHPVLRCLHDVE